MVKKYDLGEARRKTRLPFIFSGFSGKKSSFEMARDESAGTLEYIETAITKHRDSEQTEAYSEWHDLLCEASFTKGLTEGLLEMKEKTYKNHYRSLQELEWIVGEFKSSCVDITREPKSPENHLRVGKGLGRLGLAKEGEQILGIGTYWDNINDYLANK